MEGYAKLSVYRHLRLTILKFQEKFSNSDPVIFSISAGSSKSCLVLAADFCAFFRLLNYFGAILNYMVITSPGKKIIVVLLRYITMTVSTNSKY